MSRTSGGEPGTGAAREAAARAGTDGPGGLVTVTLAGREAAVPVAAVRDVLGPQSLTPVPLACPDIAGLLNLRGRIVTAIDLRPRLGAAPVGRDPAGTGGREDLMNVVIEHEGELYSLLVDAVGDVLDPPRDTPDRDMALLSPNWRAVASGLCALEDRLLVVLDVGRALDVPARARAAESPRTGAAEAPPSLPAPRSSAPAQPGPT
jgi:purine-binding chemotaxis protein CheW